MSIPRARTQTTRPTHGRQPPDGVVSGLVEEFMEEKREEKRKDTEAANRQRLRDRVSRPIFVAIVVALCGAAWFAPLPTRAPSAPPPLSSRLASTSCAWNLSARRVDPFTARHGRGPATLLDANVDEPQMVLRAMGTKDYIIQLQVASVVLTYDSSIAPAIQSDDASTILRTTLR